MRSVLLGGLTILWIGCGGSGGASFNFSCDVGSGSSRSCTDLALTGADQTQAETDCTQHKSGTIIASCPHTGAVGACAHNFTGYGGTGVTTTWSYSGSASTLMTECTQVQGTWVTP